jgi:DNA-binding winged helix-turn-helix (wHTH) protein
MKYVIQHTIYYDSLEGTLRSDNTDEDIVTLTKTASALLSVLLDNDGVMTREFLLTHVWENQGLSGSYNNLNQYLSILRRVFRRYGLDDIIISLPRLGVQLNPDIHVSRAANAPVNIAEIIPPEADALPLTETPAAGAKVRRAAKKPYVCRYCYHIVPGVILLVLSFIILFYLVDSSASSPAPYLSALPVPDCRVDALENVQNKWRPVIADDFSRVRRSLSLACNEYHHFFFYYDARLKKGGMGNTLLSQCIPRGDNPDGYCDSYFFYNWKDHES